MRVEEVEVYRERVEEVEVIRDWQEVLTEERERVSERPAP